MPLEVPTGGKAYLTVGFHSQPPPALRYPNYRGCLELDTLNEEVVSLYNFQHTFELDTAAEKPCARWALTLSSARSRAQRDGLGLMPLVCLRSKSTGDPWLTDGSYFDGTGYAEIKFESQFGTTKRFEQEIRVVSYNGIIFFLENQAGAAPLWSLHPSVGRLGHSQVCLQIQGNGERRALEISGLLGAEFQHCC